MSLKTVQDRLKSLGENLISERSLVSVYENRVDELEGQIADLNGELVRAGKTLALFHNMTSSVQERFLLGVESLVSSGLRSVFNEDIKFVIRPEVRGGRVNMDFVLVNEDGTETDLLGARGGGLVAVAGIVLRIVVLKLLQPRQSPVLFLDEPFAHLSDEYVQPAAQLLAQLAEDMGVQVILVTHQPEFAEYADQIYRLSKTSVGVIATEQEKC